MTTHHPQLTAHKGLRGEILHLLKRAQPLTAKDLARQLSVSANAISHHLKELEAEALIVYGREQRGVGAPTFAYRLSADGEALFPRAYEETLTQLLERVAGKSGRQAAVELFEDHYRELTRQLQAELAGAAASERVDLIARLMNQQGYMAEWHEAAGAFRLSAHNCDPRRRRALPRGVRGGGAISAGRARSRRRAAHAYHERMQRVRVRDHVCRTSDSRARARGHGAAMTSIEAQVLQPYKYGFVTDIEADVVPPGLSEDVIRLISAKKGEPQWMLEWRLKAYRNWLKMPEPHWSNVTYGPIDYQAISYYAAPKQRPKLDSLDQVDPKLIETFEKLGIPIEERKRLAGVAVDAVFDSVSVATTFREELKKHGVIFCAISEAIREYPELVQQYVGSVVPYNDNFFAALNSAVFTDGSFVYVPKGVRCPMELSTYFRINAESTGQFERTLIIADVGSYVSYLEGCSAPMRDENQLHAAVVELIALDDAYIKYSTVQNWYPGDAQGVGGIYNFVTKRGECRGRNAHISWTQVETGSAITWKYPSCVLRGAGSIGEFYSVATVNNHQQADTGTKMIHIGRDTRSTIISKGISAGRGQNTYRGLVKIGKNAENG